MERKRHITYIYIRVNQIDIYIQVFVGMCFGFKVEVFPTARGYGAAFPSNVYCVRLCECPLVVHHSGLLDKMVLYS